METQINQEIQDTEQLKLQALQAVLMNVGNLISIYLNEADFSRIRLLKESIDNIFIEADKAIQQSKVKAASSMN